MPASVDEELLAFALAHGESITARQLKRWRSVGLMPHRVVRGQGRGKGVAAHDRPWAKQQAIAVARTLRTNRDVTAARLRLWFDGWDVSTDHVRSLITAENARSLDQVQARREALVEQGEETIDELAIAEAMSAAEPIAASELSGLTKLAENRNNQEHETARKLVHAARTATFHALLQPDREIVAFDEDLMLGYAGGADLPTKLAESGLETDKLGEALAKGFSQMFTPALFQTPSASDLEDARAKLHVYAHLVEAVAANPPPDIPLLSEMLGSADLRFLPTHAEHETKYLLSALVQRTALSTIGGQK